MNDCACIDWKPNVDRINNYITLATIRSGFQHQYAGVPFRYCPWCGGALPGTVIAGRSTATVNGDRNG